MMDKNLQLVYNAILLNNGLNTSQYGAKMVALGHKFNTKTILKQLERQGKITKNTITDLVNGITTYRWFKK